MEALFQRIKQGDITAVNELAIRNEINIIHDHRTALHLAVECCQIEIVKKLLIFSDIDTANEAERTAIHFAAESGNYEITKLLIEHNADFTGASVYQMFPIHLAIINGNSDVVRLFCNPDDVDYQNDNGFTPLHLSCIYDDYISTSLLISNKCDLNTKNNSDHTPMDYAKNEILLLLFKNEASIEESKNEKENYEKLYFLGADLSGTFLGTKMIISEIIILIGIFRNLGIDNVYKILENIFCFGKETYRKIISIIESKNGSRLVFGNISNHICDIFIENLNIGDNIKMLE